MEFVNQFWLLMAGILCLIVLLNRSLIYYWSARIRQLIRFIRCRYREFYRYYRRTKSFNLSFSKMSHHKSRHPMSGGLQQYISQRTESPQARHHNSALSYPSSAINQPSFQYYWQPVHSLWRRRVVRIGVKVPQHYRFSLINKQNVARTGWTQLFITPFMTMALKTLQRCGRLLVKFLLASPLSRLLSYFGRYRFFQICCRMIKAPIELILGLTNAEESLLEQRLQILFRQNIEIKKYDHAFLRLLVNQPQLQQCLMMHMQQSSTKCGVINEVACRQGILWVELILPRSSKSSHEMMKRAVGRWVPAMMELAAALRQQSATGRDDKHISREQEGVLQLLRATYQLVMALGNNVGRQLLNKLGMRAPRWLALILLVGLFSLAINDRSQSDHRPTAQPYFSSISETQLSYFESGRLGKNFSQF